MSPSESATAYELTLKKFYCGETLDVRRPLFNVTLLGIGEDGHTASLFPGQISLSERTRWVLDVKSPKDEPRITLTLDGHTTREPCDRTSTFAFMWPEVVKAVRERGAIRTTAANGVRNARVIDDIYRAAGMRLRGL